MDLGFSADKMGKILKSSPDYNRIGLCYELEEDYIANGAPAELVHGFECVRTIDAIAAALDKAGYIVIRLGSLHQIVQKLAANGGNLDCDLVFNIHSGVYGRARESQAPAIFEAYQIPFTLSDAATMAWCIDKAKTKVSLCSQETSKTCF